MLGWLKKTTPLSLTQRHAAIESRYSSDIAGLKEQAEEQANGIEAAMGVLAQDLAIVNALRSRLDA